MSDELEQGVLALDGQFALDVHQKRESQHCLSQSTRLDVAGSLHEESRTALVKMVSALQISSGADSVLITLLDESAVRILANCSHAGKCADGLTAITPEESLCRVAFSDKTKVDRRLPIGCIMGYAQETNLCGQICEVKDTLLDPELHDRPWVIGGPKVRYYFGSELVKGRIYICCLGTTPGRPSEVESRVDFQAFLKALRFVKTCVVAMMQAEQMLDVSILSLPTQSLVGAFESVIEHEKQTQEITHQELKAAYQPTQQSRALQREMLRQALAQAKAER